MNAFHENIELTEGDDNRRVESAVAVETLPLKLPT
jgi:hypothetical protein